MAISKVVAKRQFPYSVSATEISRSPVNRQKLVFTTAFAAIFVLLFLPAHAGAQADATEAQNPLAASGPSALTPSLPDISSSMQADRTPPAVPDGYIIGNNDLLSIFVFQMPDLTREVRVASDGTIRLPMLSQPLIAAGQTAPQLDNEIEHALTRAGLAISPTVQVIVRQVLSHPIIVSGAVKTPIVIQATRPLRLFEALARAGGLGGTAGTTVLLAQKTSVGTVTREIDLKKLTESTDPSDDPLLTGGEVVRVLPARMVYAVGAFQKPGAFPVHADEPLTVLKAIALAQGFNPAMQADKKRSEIIRPTADGSHIEIPINIDQILKRESPDRILQAGDVLYVPENGKRKALTAALEDASQILIIGVGYNASHIF